MLATTCNLIKIQEEQGRPWKEDLRSTEQVALEVSAIGKLAWVWDHPYIWAINFCVERNFWQGWGLNQRPLISVQKGEGKRGFPWLCAWLFSCAIRVVDWLNFTLLTLVNIDSIFFQRSFSTQPRWCLKSPLLRSTSSSYSVTCSIKPGRWTLRTL